MAKRLTHQQVQAWAPAAARQEIADGSGLRLVVQPSGAKSWIVRYRFEGRTRKVTNPAFIALAQARQWAAWVQAEVAAGRDPGAEQKTERRQVREAEAAAKLNTVDALFIKFLSTYTGRRKVIRASTRAETGRLLGLAADGDGWRPTGGGGLAKWGGKPVAAITKVHVVDLLDDLAKHPVTRNRTLRAVRQVFEWAKERDDKFVVPTGGIRMLPETARTRVLDDDEVRALWRACEKIATPFARMAQLLLITTVRRDEAREAPWAEIDSAGMMWRLVEDRTKPGRALDLPLSGEALRLLAKLPRISPWLFTTGGRGPIQELSKAKRMLDAEMASELGRPLVGWKLHDLRRTAATGMQGVGVPIETIEAVLNHSLRGTIARYARHDYGPQKKDALDRWAARLREIVGPEQEAATNVVAIR
jgi:integrase